MIEITEHGPVREITMAHPPVNALGPESVGALREALAEAFDGPAAGIVLTGREGLFSAGLDVPRLLGLERDALLAFWEDFLGLMEQLSRAPVPVFSAINGHCPAGGMVLALFTDRRIAARGEFKLGLNEVQVGLPVPEVILHALRRQVGPRAAEQLAVAGRLVDPEEAFRLGLVDALAEPESVVTDSVAEMTDLVSRPRQAMQLTREVLRADLVTLWDDGARATARRMVDVWTSDEAQTALRALVEQLAAKKG